MNERDNFGNSALLLAVIGTGHLDTFKLLFNHPDTERNIANQQGMNALIWAASRGHKDILQFLIDQPDLHNTKDIDGFTALHHSAAHGDLEQFITLYTCPGVDKMAKSKHGLNAMMVACVKGATEIVEFLLAQRGLDPNETDTEGNTVLLLAAASGNLEVFKVICRYHSVDREVCNKQGRNATVCAARNGNSEIIKYIVDTGGRVDLTKADGGGSTAMNYALEGGDMVTFAALYNSL